jgi:nucleoside-diphosphate-sugar epimerase
MILLSCQMFTRLYGLETFVIRCFNVFGPSQDPGSPYFGGHFAVRDAADGGKQQTIYGDGGQTREFTDTANVVDGVLRACEAPKEISLNELVVTLNKIVGTNIQTVYKDERDWCRHA